MNYSLGRSRSGQFVALIVATIVASAILFIATPAYAVTAAEKEAEAQEALNQLYALQDTLEQKSAEYYQSLAEYQDAVTLRDAAQERIDAISGEITEIQGRLGSRAREMYRNGATSFIDLLFGATSFDEFTQNWDILNRLNSNDAELSTKAKALRNETKRKKTELTKQAGIAEKKSANAQRAYKESQELVAQMQETYNGLSAEARRLYEEEQAAAAAAAAAAAQAQAEAEAAAAAEYDGDDGSGAYEDEETGETYYYSDGDNNYVATEGAVENDDGTVTDINTGETYDSPTEYTASTGNEIVDRAASMLGSAYQYGGTGADGTFDCSGLVGYALTGTTERIGNTTSFMSDYNQVSDPQPGDIAVNAGHTGIYIGNGQMIHAGDESTGVIVGDVQDGMIYVRP